MVVDDSIPCDANGAPLLLTSANSNEIWPLILSKVIWKKNWSLSSQLIQVSFFAPKVTYRKTLKTDFQVFSSEFKIHYLDIWSKEITTILKFLKNLIYWYSKAFPVPF